MNSNDLISDLILKVSQIFSINVSSIGLLIKRKKFNNPTFTLDKAGITNFSKVIAYRKLGLHPENEINSILTFEDIGAVEPINENPKAFERFLADPERFVGSTNGFKEETISVQFSEGTFNVPNPKLALLSFDKRSPNRITTPFKISSEDGSQPLKPVKIIIDCSPEETKN